MPIYEHVGGPDSYTTKHWLMKIDVNVNESLSQFQWHEVTRSTSTPPGWDTSRLQGYLNHKYTSTHLYTWVEKGTVSVRCLAQEHNAMSTARAQTWTTAGRDESAVQ